jgi:nucleoid DNA-binding protein
MKKNEKPVSMSHKDWFVKQLSKKHNIDEQTIHKIINHQYESVIQATQKNKTIELTGFGCIIWNDKRAQRKLDSMDDTIRVYREKIANGHPESKMFNGIIDDILMKRQTLINRINELNSDIRRVEKSLVAKKAASETYKRSRKRKTEDL